jgi:two-component system chemotaxis sensor kinase CheA
VVVEGDNEKIGIVVDDLLGQQQVVIKSLEQNYTKVSGISGATILGDGTVALIIDISSIGRNITPVKKHQGKSDQAA